MNQLKNLTTLILLIFTLTACNKDGRGISTADIPCEDTNCADYSSRLAAQADYDADPDCRGDLDADNDGIACEEPGNSVSSSGSSGGSGNVGGTGCPTTANCGCSGKNKSPCQADPCCKWVVGEGCECD